MGCKAEVAEVSAEAGPHGRSRSKPRTRRPCSQRSVSCISTDSSTRATEGTPRVDRGSAAPVRGGRRRDELGEVPHRRTRARRSWRTIVDRAEVTSLGEQLDGTGMIGEEPLERTIDAAVGMVEEARREGVRADRRGGDGGAPDTRPTRITRSRSRAPDRRDDRGAGRGRREPARIPGCHELNSRSPTAPSWSSTPEAAAAVHVRTWIGGRRAVQRGRRRRRFTERFELERLVEPDRLEEVLAAIADDLALLDGRASPDAMVGMGGAITNMTAVALGLAGVRPRPGPGIRPRTDGGRSSGRVVPIARRRRASLDRRPPTEARRGDPRRRVHRPHGDGEARRVIPDRERPGLRHGVLIERFGH